MEPALCPRQIPTLLTTVPCGEKVSYSQVDGYTEELEGWFADCLINATTCKDVHGYLGVAVSLWPCPLKCITRDREDCDGACLVFLGV